MDRVNYRLIETKDFPGIIKVMEELNVPIAGMHSFYVYDKFCHYAIGNDKVIFVIAEIKSKIIGLSITIIDYKCFWREFLANHLLISIKILLTKFFKLFKSYRSRPSSSNSIDISKYLSKKITNRSWKDSSPVIAKVIYVAVSKELRKMGIGKGLYEFRFMILQKKGVKRLDSKINHMNIAPIKLAYNEGRQIVKEKNGMLFTTLDL